MITADIDKTTTAEKRILFELSGNFGVGQVKFTEIPRDENGNHIGVPWKEVKNSMSVNK